MNKKTNFIKPPHDFEELPVELVQDSFLKAFARIVQKFPKNIAITSRGKQITYQELDVRSNSLASVIFNQLGVGKSPVALLLDHNVEVIIALLAVLKTGRPYVAMDFSFPLDRMKQIMADAQAEMLIFDDANEAFAKDVLRDTSQILKLNVNVLDYSIYSDRFEAEISFKDAGIIFYTSGSTGRPKGVVWSHQQIISNAIFNANDLRLSPSDRFMLISSVAFASSRTVIYDSLVSGARISMFDVKTHGIHELKDWMLSEQITLFRGGLQVFRTLFSDVPKDFIFPDLRMVGFGGQPAVPKDVTLCREHTPADCIFLFTFVNTETGVITNCAIDRATVVKGESIPVGYPLGDKEIYLINEEGQPVENDQEGEIVVKSKFLSLGYLNHPELNAEKFKYNPDNTTTFFTGDIGIWNMDGQLEHRGRKDDLVKIRGYSVKLSEVEIMLRKNPMVKDVAVVTVFSKNNNQSKQLVAYIVPVADEKPTARQIRTHLAEQLPRYMVPAFVIFLDAIPQTINGKVDRKSLPEVPEKAELLEEDLPVGQMEKRLLSIWDGLLRVKNIGVNDNFFDLGGDSLLAMQLLLAIEKEFSGKMPLAIISKASTVRQQAEILSDEKAIQATSILIPIKTDGEKEPIYCLAGAGGNAFRFHPLLKYLPTNRPVYFIRSRGLEAGEWIETTVEGIASGYLLELKRIQPRGPYHFIGSSGGGLTAYEMAQQLQHQGEKVGLFIMLDTFVPQKKNDGTQTFTNGSEGFRGFLKKKKMEATHLFKKWKKRLRRQQQRIKQNGFPGYIQFLVQFFKFRFDVVTRNFAKESIYKLQRQVEKANYAAGRAYQIKPYSGRILYFRADRKTIRQGKPPEVRWENFGVKDLVIHPMNCGHFDLLLEPYVQLVAERINQELNRSAN